MRPEDSTYTSSPKADQEPNRRTPCTTCGLTVSRPSDLPRHMLLHAKNKEDFMFQCPFPECGHKTLQKSNLETHIIIHTNTRPLQCPVIFSDRLRCDFTSSHRDPSSLPLQGIYSLHHMYRPFCATTMPCEHSICTNSPPNRRADSSATSTQQKIYPKLKKRTTCITCGLTVKRPSDLPRHMLLHVKNKEDFMFQCPFPECGHKTLQKSNLETHIRIHTNVRPLQCPVVFSDGLRCTFTSSDPSSLHRHKKRKHEDGK